jgi:methionine sulfoxide reductase heme-binding subunit
MQKLLGRYSALQILTYFVGAFPFFWLIWDAIANNLTVNPIQALTLRTGRYALTFLLLSLACTPASSILGLKQAIKVRRPLGLFAFFYAALHVSIFVLLDYGLNLRLILEAMFEKRYLLVGAGAFTILLFLAVTSFNWWKKRLKKNWKRLHRLVYLAGILVIVHFIWASKGDLQTFSGEIIRPILYGIVLIGLLVVRWRPVKQNISALFTRKSRWKLSVLKRTS